MSGEPQMTACSLAGGIPLKTDGSEYAFVCLYARGGGRLLCLCQTGGRYDVVKV